MFNVKARKFKAVMETLKLLSASVHLSDHSVEISSIQVI